MPHPSPLDISILQKNTAKLLPQENRVTRNMLNFQSFHPVFPKLDVQAEVKNNSAW